MLDSVTSDTLTERNRSEKYEKQNVSWMLMVKHVPIPIRNCAATQNQKLTVTRNFSPKPVAHRPSPTRFIWISDSRLDSRLKNRIITMMPPKLPVDVKTTCSVETPQMPRSEASTGV